MTDKCPHSRNQTPQVFVGNVHTSLVAGGPKFLFDDLPDPPAAGDGAAGPELLGANPAFANVFKVCHMSVCPGSHCLASACSCILVDLRCHRLSQAAHAATQKPLDMLNLQIWPVFAFAGIADSHLRARSSPKPHHKPRDMCRTHQLTAWPCPQASLARQRSMTDSSGAGSSADSSGDEAAAAPPPAVPQAPQQQPRDRPDAPPRPAPVDPDRCDWTSTGSHCSEGTAIVLC